MEYTITDYYIGGNGGRGGLPEDIQKCVDNQGLSRRMKPPYYAGYWAFHYCCGVLNL